MSSRLGQPGWRAAGALLLAATLPARAALFDDDEARKAILELRNRVTASEEAHKVRLNELTVANAQLQEQIQALRRSLLDLNGQIESLRVELARQRGNEEQLARDVADLQRRQRDVVAGLDDRLRKMEPQKVSVDGQEFLADPDEKRSFDDAMNAMRGGDFDRALASFQLLQRRYPASGYLPASLYWSANAQYGRKDYKEAVASFRSFLNAAPQHPKAPEAMLGLANSLAETKDVRGARKVLEDLQKAYPGSEAAVAAKQRLTTLR